MSFSQKNSSGSIEQEKFPPADTGNASNPSPQDESTETGSRNQLLDEKAENYLRESGNIEDMPDTQDQQDADQVIKKENNNQLQADK